MPIARWRNPGARTLAAVAVLVAHVAVLMSLRALHVPVTRILWDDSAILLVSVPSEAPPPPPSLNIGLFAAGAPPDIELQLPVIDPAALAGDSTEPSDWFAAGARAAGMAAADTVNTRESGTAQLSSAKPRKPKPFGWDRTHTQRIEALPQGGIRIRLSDRCGMVLAPWPMGGCSLGKIDARGDLFAGMGAKVEFGDWQDSATSSTHR